MDLAQLRELLEMVPEMRARGVQRVRLGELEIELGVGDFVLASELEGEPSSPGSPSDPNKCSTPGCGAPVGRWVKGLCRGCALNQAGVSLD